MIRLATKEDIPFVSGILDMDPTNAFERCTVLVSDNGGFFLEPVTETVFEAHMFFTPGNRRDAINDAREALKYMFNHGAYVIFGRIPVNDRPARLMTRWIGLKSIGIRPKFEGGEIVEWFEITRDTCLQQQQ